MLKPGTVLQNRYEIVRPIGQGGMGAVYESLDKRLRKTVALKQVLFTDKAMKKAFEREAILLANLNHTALTPVIDHFFEENGQFLVMEYIPGDDLASRMERIGGKFPPAEVVPWALQWTDQLLDALEYLHAQKPPVIHRDIKPQNLKLTPRGGIILLDFGLARGGLADISTVTARSSVEGYTPNYAPMEQIRGSEPDVRSDLYSLAATMYHVLTGNKPPDALTRAANLLNNQKDPLRLANELNPNVPAPVAAVLQGTMALNPDNRPPTAGVMRKALKRTAQSGLTEPRVRKDSQEMGTADSPVVTQNLHVSAQNISISGPATSQLDAAPPTQKLEANEPPGTLIRTITTGSSLLTVAFSPDGLFGAAAGEDNTVGLWQLSDGQMIRTFEGHSSPIRSITFSPDGSMLASGSADKTVRLWSVKDGSEIYQTELDAIEGVAFSPDGTLLAVGGWASAISLFKITDQMELEEIETFSAGIVNCLAFSPDGKFLAAGCYDTNILLWTVSDGELVRTLEGHTNFVFAVAFSPDGQMLASGGGDSTSIIRIWRVNDGRQLDMLQGHTNFIHGVAFHPEGKMLASGSADSTARIWRMGDGATLYTLDEHGSGVTSVAFSPDGRTLLTGSRDTKLRLWQAK